MSGNTGITGNTLGTDLPWSSTTGTVAPSTQIQLMDDAERDSAGQITPSDANKVSEVLTGIISWAKSQATGMAVQLGAALTRLKQILTFRTTTTGAISRRQIDPATTASVTYTTSSPYVSNFFDGAGNNVSVSYDNLGNSRDNPAMDSALGVVAAKAITKIDVSGAAQVAQYQRIVRGKFRIADWRMGSTSPLLRYGVRNSQDSESAVLHLERDNSGMWLNYQRENGTAVRCGVGARHGRARDAAHFQIGDIIELDTENHLYNPADPSSSLQLVIVANVVNESGQLQDVIQFNYTGQRTNASPAMVSASHLDFSKVRWYSGDNSQADSAPTAYVETWQNKANTPLNELLHHDQLQTVNSHEVTDTQKLGGFWTGSPVSHMDVGNVVIDAGGFEKNGQPYAEIPEWQANTAYTVGQLRRNGIVAVYMCKAEHTSGANFPTGQTLTDNWILLS